MATLTPGVVLKLLDGIKTGVKPTTEHRNSLLQVIDIVPAELDEKNLWPKHGFYIKVSDSSHSIYVSLPYEQDDLVLSDKMQLGQFIYIKKFEPGSPVPIAVGAKPIPGRHPLMGTPEPLMGLRGKQETNQQKINGTLRRGSWGLNLNQTRVDGIPSPTLKSKQLPLDFDQYTPMREKMNSVKFNGPISHVVRVQGGKDHRNSAPRASVCGVGFASKLESKGESLALVRKSCITPTTLKFTRSITTGERGAKIATTSLNSSVEKYLFSPLLQGKESSPPASISKAIPRQQSQSSNLTLNSTSSIPVNLPGKLRTLGKEAMQQRERAQKIALQALRHATATDNVVRCLKTFANLSESAKADAPAACFDQFLDFHQQLVQAVTDMVSIQAATLGTDTKAETGEASAAILHEIAQHSMDQLRDTDTNNASKRRSELHKSIARFPERMADQRTSNRRALRSHSKTMLEKKGRCSIPLGNDENQQPGGSGYLSNMIKLGKQIEREAGNWFMDFIEQALETGMKKSKGKSDFDVREVPQSLMLKVINWVEAEQSDSRKRPIHPNAAKIARKLRIKAKSP
ncbi:hypothetical protein Cgig2_007050 [Carnegiea gigantea]|uniref:Uncharacterized protein n=1 Tax=Carnegiea gigantea TaxID=171969 RepID=A0A9Q1KAX1_9CARY|nr:hypothetical protein Cgig2_007050 [Carnegiea gigantea]